MLLNTAVDQFLTGYFATHQRAEKTQTAYALDLRQFQEFAGTEINIALVKATTIETWVAELRTSYSPRSIRRKIACLKVFFSYWVRKDILTESPFWRVRISFGRILQLPKTLTQTEMRSLLFRAQEASCQELTKPSASGFQQYRRIRNLVLLEILFATGIRVGEAASLNLEHYDGDENVLVIKGKGGRDRLAFIVDPTAIKIMNRYVRARRRIESDSPALFLNPALKRLSTQGIANVVGKFRRELKIQRPVTPHMFRHTVATLLLRNGVDIRVVQEFLGHASIATTQQYTHIAKDHLINVLSKRHPSQSLRFSS